MEDGAFLGQVLSEVVRGVINIPEAIDLYEKRRIPKAFVKQQISFISGTFNMAEGEDAERRDKASAVEVQAWDRDVIHGTSAMSPSYRSWQMFCTPTSVPSILYYDAEGDADNAVCEYLQAKTELDAQSLVTKGLWDKYWGYLDYSGSVSI